MRLLFLSLVILLSACTTVSQLPHQIAKLPDEIVYKLPTRQGNVIEQRQLDQLRVGMTRDQVKFLMGTPVASNPFREDRWDYFGYYKSPRGEVSQRNVVLYFDDKQLTHMEGVHLASLETGIKSTSEEDALNALEKQQKSDSSDRVDHARDENPAGLPTDGGVPSPEGSNLPAATH